MICKTCQQFESSGPIITGTVLYRKDSCTHEESDPHKHNVLTDLLKPVTVNYMSVTVLSPVVTGFVCTVTAESLIRVMGLKSSNYSCSRWQLLSIEKGTSRQRSGKGAIRKRFPLQKPRWEKTKLTIRHLYHETYRKLNEQLFSQ